MTRSLAHLTDAEYGPPGTLHARSLAGGLKVPPIPGRTVRFGRAEETRADFVPVCRDDLGVSRAHGAVRYDARSWWLRNDGDRLLRLPSGRKMHATTDPIPLSPGYTAVFVQGTGYREHVLELYVTDHEHDGPGSRAGAPTIKPSRWHLEEEERHVLVVLGQDYIRYEPDARPLPRRRVVEQLNILFPDAERPWTTRRVDDILYAVRKRLHESGRVRRPLVPDTDNGRAYDNTLMHNLLTELVDSTTLVPPDLAELDL
ncbi:FHA domain-containing protein [Streptomyces sp. 6N223]|uniref:FHA domain-containing protein n=1 Tax=Streptomyces sp. 6N223 TaxID=3457412 RepID=UPI003FD47B68